MVLGTYREIELDRVHPLSQALVDWDRERFAVRVPLARLSAEQTAALLATLLGQDTVTAPFAEAIFKETEGNPFFIEETVKTLIDQGQIEHRTGEGYLRAAIEELAIPQSVRAAISRRLDRMSEACTTVLHTAAAIGKTFDFNELVEVSTHDEDVVLDALDEATSAQLLISAGRDAFKFTHDKIREVLYEGTQPDPHAPAASTHRRGDREDSTSGRSRHTPGISPTTTSRAATWSAVPPGRQPRPGRPVPCSLMTRRSSTTVTRSIAPRTSSDPERVAELQLQLGRVHIADGDSARRKAPRVHRDHHGRRAQGRGRWRGDRGIARQAPGRRAADRAHAEHEPAVPL